MCQANLYVTNENMKNHFKAELPTKLKHGCLNQIDHILTFVDSSELVSVSLISRIVDEHLASLAVFETLQQLDQISLKWQHWSSIHGSDLKNSPLLCFNSEGDTYVLSNKKGNEYFLQCFFKPDEEVDSFWVTKEEMFKDMHIHPQALSITKKQYASTLAQPFSPPPSKDADLDGSATNIAA